MTETEMHKERPKRPTRILVVDSSRVFAKMVRDILLKHVRNSEVDVATNVYELKRRMGDNRYDLVIADVSVAADGDDMAKEIQKSSGVVVAWSAVQTKKNACHPFMEMRKPISLDEITKAMPKILDFA